MINLDLAVLLLDSLYILSWRDNKYCTYCDTLNKNHKLILSKIYFLIRFTSAKEIRKIIKLVASYSVAYEVSVRRHIAA